VATSQLGGMTGFAADRQKAKENRKNRSLLALIFKVLQILRICQWEF